ncbi:RNA-directed DNA polymerase, eukaryota [Tanacetum coccineum]
MGEGGWSVRNTKSGIGNEGFSILAFTDTWLIQASSEFTIDKRVTMVEIEGIPLKVWNENTFIRIASKWGTLLNVENLEKGNYHCKRLCVLTKSMSHIFESFKINYKGKTHWVRAIEIPGWTPDLDDQNDEESDSEDAECEEVFKKDFDVEEENPKSKDDVVSSEQNGKQSEDPFNIYSLLNKDKMKNNKEASTKESLEYPPGFTPRENDVENIEMDNQKDNCDGEFGNVNNISDEVKFSSGFKTNKKAGGESMDSDHCRESEGSRKGGSILMLMDELVKVGQTMGVDGVFDEFVVFKYPESYPKAKKRLGKGLCVSNKVNFLTLQETKMESIDLFEIKRCWGNFAFDYVHSASVGKSELSEKKSLWDYLCHVIDNWKGSVIIMGDFNEVRNKNERFGTIFNVHGANAFNSFISMANLEEVPLGGCSFTWCHRSASKMSKLDRFLMFESLLSECPNLSAITLDRFLSDHRPILLRESTHDYGPIPFWFFHYWLEMEGFENFVNEVWREAPVDNSNAMINMMNKLKYLKKKIRVWNGMRQSPKTRKHVLKQELADLEMIIDKGDASSDTLHKRAEVVKSIQEVDKLCAMEASQKAKIKWAIEGDENSKYYHGILNKKRNQLSIRGVLVEGDWVENPNMVKNEFLNHFKNRFDRPKSVRPMLNMEFPHHLNSMQQLDLEAEVSNEEIKKAVWDCGVDKSPGPDGFTFGFYKRFWSLIEKDVLAAVKYFFHYSRIPKGCNSSFIALIPKTPEAKMVKDFRPISLIGSLYKIIAKILANRLVVVLGDIVNEVQSAFVADRQILDGPFILNEVLQWCKLKKKHSFILKIDFEKAYDSVRWDYLDDVLRKFGFGEKWCGWIQECLRSSWGSVLVNGSPTEEFQFFKGLKQGDPLSPFIFILVMESLHISFKRVVDAGMFNGIVLNSVMHLSHMFYADDAVFMGQWSTKNIDTIIYVLKCFHRASGLSINLSKSKLLGVVVSEDRVVQAANRIGCGVLKAPFAYLGSKVGGNMSRIKSWDEIVDKMVDRLSKWKMKTLSIGGRLTLLKAVLGSMPIYHMSIFKVPMKVLQRMKSIRSRFFSGVDLNSKNLIWVKWSKVLCSKEKGGLGVSRLLKLFMAKMGKMVADSRLVTSPFDEAFSRSSRGASGSKNVALLRTGNEDEVPCISVLEVLKKMFRGEFKDHPRGTLQLNAMRMAEIFADDNNFKSFIVLNFTESLTRVFSQPCREFLCNWCSSERDPVEEDVHIEFDSVAAAGEILGVIPRQDVTKSTYSTSRARQTPYAHQKSSLLVKIIAHLTCFIPNMCPGEKGLLSNKFFQCLEMEHPNLPNGAARTSGERAAAAMKNLRSLLAHAGCLVPEYLCQEDVNIFSLFIKELEALLGLPMVRLHRLIFFENADNHSEGVVTEDHIDNQCNGVTEPQQDASSMGIRNSFGVREIAEVDPQEEIVRSTHSGEKQQKKRKGGLMNDTQVAMIENALKGELDMHWKAETLKLWADKLSSHGSEITSKQLSNWLCYRKVKLARAAAKDGDTASASHGK